MEISRLLFSKETQQKLEQELTIREKSKLRWQKLKEAAESGVLDKARNRFEVANIAGYTGVEEQKGYAWVANLIRRGHLKEHIYGQNKWGKMEFEYHIATEPDFDHKSSGRKKKPTERVDDTLEEPSKLATKRPPNLKKRGREMFARLLEVAESGKIAQAKTRTELANLTDTSRSWVSGLIERDYLREVLVDYNGSTPIYKYSLTGKKPNYDNVKLSRNAVVPEGVETHTRMDEIKNDQAIKLEISRKDITIKLELSGYGQVEELIKAIVKGD